jgi:ribosome-binding protein aMBF1 (putative translation factor)
MYTRSHVCGRPRTGLELGGLRTALARSGPVMTDPSPLAMALGAAITAARVRAGVASQSELARRMGARPEHVGHWERGDRTAPTVDTLARIARVLGRIEATLPDGSTITVTAPGVDIPVKTE